MKYHPFVPASVIMILITGALTVAVPASADDESNQHSASSDRVSAVVKKAVEAADVTDASPGESDATQKVSVTVPKVATDGIEVQRGDTAAFTVPTPIGLSLKDGVVTRDGSTVYRGTSGDPDVSVMPLKNGVRISTVIWNNNQQSIFSYPLAEGISASVQPDGRVELTKTMTIESNGMTVEMSFPVGYFESAWARDAAGNTVFTSYSVKGNTLIQKVETENAVFPVVADPQWEFTGLTEVRIHFTRAETAAIASGEWGITELTTICADAGTAIGGIVGATVFKLACAAAANLAASTAEVAEGLLPKLCLSQYIEFVPAMGIVTGVPRFKIYECS